jgi:hypothetical protein
VAADMAVSKRSPIFVDKGTFLTYTACSITKTLIERKSRVPQLQGVQGRGSSRLPRTLGNAEDGSASSFPKGKTNSRIIYHGCSNSK